jgi:hypothetical protein
MIKILLLDCPAELTQKLREQGYDVEAGTIGFATGKRTLPSQVYEKQVFFYSPSRVETQRGRAIEGEEIEDSTPEYELSHLADTINRGATFVVFVNRLSDDLRTQSRAYSWIPFMPRIQFTKDHWVGPNTFKDYPNDKCRFLNPVVDPKEVKIPVRQKLITPAPQAYPRDIFTLFVNGNSEKLGVLIACGIGFIIVLPEFRSNSGAIATFIQRVLPKMYDLKADVSLVDRYISPAEKHTQQQITAGETEINRIELQLEQQRVSLEAARRNKESVIQADHTSKQVLSYYDTALHQEDVALFYLYKAVEFIENNHGGESAAIKKFGFGSEWKFLKKTVNASYADVRHAPKPGDVIKRWTDEEIQDCFEAVEKIILSYFSSLFP